MKRQLLLLMTLLCSLLILVACGNKTKEDNMVSSLVSDGKSTVSDLVSKGNSIVDDTVSRLDPGDGDYHAPNAHTVH